MYDIHLVHVGVNQFNFPLDLITCTEGHYHMHVLV